MEELVDYALKNNLDLQAAQNNVEIANALVDAASWQAMPQVDFIGSLTSHGFRRILRKM